MGRQKNLTTRKEREIRPPMRRGRDGRQHHWKAPSAPIVPPGETTVVSVPSGGPGTVIHVPFPNKPGKFIAVSVPANAKVGQAMLVPLPKEDTQTVMDTPTGGMSTGAKIATGAAVVVGVGGL